VICWHNEDGVNHTATSDSGLFDTNAIAPGAEVGSTFYGPGTYRYHCEIHPSMDGRFNVRPAASDASIPVGDTFELTVGPSGASVEAPTWDVQRRRNDGPWIQFKTATTDPIFDVQPLRAGTLPVPGSDACVPAGLRLVAGADRDGEPRLEGGPLPLTSSADTAHRARTRSMRPQRSTRGPSGRRPC